MRYIESFILPDSQIEERAIHDELRTVFNDFYPFGLFPNKNVSKIEFEPITILYGDNGSGKSTLLNLIAQKVNAQRKQAFHKGEFFYKYLELCDFKMKNKVKEIKIITSDDIFNFLLDTRYINSKIDNCREELFEEYIHYNYHAKASDYMNDYDNLKKLVEARKKKSMSSYVRTNLVKGNIIEHSNGESALMYFEQQILDGGLYILDEPENSLSVSSVLKLAKFIEESARFFNCQFIISTHSPILLALKDAKIVNLDNNSRDWQWYELENVRLLYDFFKDHKPEFEPK